MQRPVEGMLSYTYAKENPEKDSIYFRRNVIYWKKESLASSQYY